ncbi:MAG: response regulator [Chloroflexi bacterium]|nr:response regulator [Chloroflexota bacterium]
MNRLERQILLVDDQAIQLPTLSRRLTQDKYAVTVATNYAQARQLLETAHFHLAILDICLDHTAGRNEDGLRLLEDIEKLGLREIMPCIVLTAYGNEERAVRALQDLRAKIYVHKEPRYIATVLEHVKALFANDVGINFDIEYEGNSLTHLTNAIHDIHAADTGWPPMEQLIPQARDLIGKLFPEASGVMIKPMPKGLSGSAVLRVRATYPRGGLAQWVVVKIGRGEKTKIEQDHCRAYVERFLPAAHATHLTAKYTQHLGGLLYTLQNLDVGQTRDFADFYAKRPASQVISALDNLFFKTCSLWYNNPSALGYVNLRDLYLQAFELENQPERIPNELAVLRSDINWQAETIRLEPPGTTLPNPVRWWRDSDAGMIAVSQRTTHGDLHAGNILMDDKGECWLIDFYRTHPSHLLRDVVKLEVDIKFNLLDPQPAENFAEMEQLLAGMKNPADGVTLFKSQSPAMHKAVQVIVGLRQIAWRLLGGTVTTPSHNEFLYEYLYALLMTTLNVLRLRHYKEIPRLQPYRELALLSAALICRELERLSPTK